MDNIILILMYLPYLLLSLLPFVMVYCIIRWCYEKIREDFGNKKGE